MANAFHQESQRTGAALSLYEYDQLTVVAADENTESTCLMYDPLTTTFTQGPRLHAGIQEQSATMLKDGSILVAGGEPNAGGNLTAAVQRLATRAMLKLPVDAKYTLAAGETFQQAAKTLHVAPNDLINANFLPGTQLQIAGCTHQPKAGETLQEIASRYQVDAGKLITDNKTALAARKVSELNVPPKSKFSTTGLSKSDIEKRFRLDTNSCSWTHKPASQEPWVFHGKPSVLAPGQSLTITVAGVVSDLPDGPTNMYVSFKNFGHVPDNDLILTLQKHDRALNASLIGHPLRLFRQARLTGPMPVVGTFNNANNKNIYYKTVSHQTYPGTITPDITVENYVAVVAGFEIHCPDLNENYDENDYAGAVINPKNHHWELAISFPLQNTGSWVVDLLFIDRRLFPKSG